MRYELTAGAKARIIFDLLLAGGLLQSGDIEPVAEVGVAGQGIAGLALYEDIDALDAGYVDGQGFNEGVDGELFAENAGAVLVDEGGVEIDEGCSGIDEVDGADIGCGGEGMGGSGQLVEAQQGAEEFFG